MQPEKLVLASASPRRKELLERLGVKFDVFAADVEEDNLGEKGPAEMVRQNADLKASALAERVPNALVLGSDTTVALGNEILNKPVDMAEAREMLGRLSGNTHVVYTAVALIWNLGEFTETFVEASEVRFKHFDGAVIERYFEQVNPLDKAGPMAYNRLAI